MTSRIFVTFMNAGALLNIGRASIDWRHNRARRWIRLLSSVNSFGFKSLRIITVIHSDIYSWLVLANLSSIMVDQVYLGNESNKTITLVDNGHLPLSQNPH